MHLSVNRKRSDEIERIISIGESGAAKVTQIIEAADPMISFSDSTSALKGVVGDEIALLIFLHMSSLAVLADRERMTPSEVLGTLRSGLVNFGWSEEKLVELDTLIPTFESWIKHKFFYIGAKASDLVTTSGKNIGRSKIVVDARPIFDNDREEIEVFVVFSSLMLNLNDGLGGEENISISLGVDEIEELKRECEEALRKVNKTQENITNTSGKRALVYGKHVGST